MPVKDIPLVASFHTRYYIIQKLGTGTVFCGKIQFMKSEKENKRPEEILRDYYKQTAGQYDSHHCMPGDEHYRALNYIKKIANDYRIKTFLDVGCGTGRGIEFLMNNGFDATGVDSSQELMNQGVIRNPALKSHMYCEDAYHLPYGDSSFDAVCAFGILHHLKYPDLVIREMLRIARKAVFISDSNRFGQGPAVARYIQLCLWNSKLWPLANYIKTKGKGYILSEDDGLSYSYSVYDSYNLLSKWAEKIVDISTDEEGDKPNPGPLILRSSHLLLFALKK